MHTQPFHQRVLVGAALTLEYVHLDQFGDPATLGSDPTVAVVRRSDGASVTAGTVVAPSSGAPKIYTAPIIAANNTQLDELVCTWTADGVAQVRVVQVVGGVYFGLDQAEDDGHETYDLARPNIGRRRRARSIAEQECERITGVAWVPQMAQRRIVVATTDDTLLVPNVALRTLRAVDEYASDGALSASWTAAQIAATEPLEYGAFQRLAATWTRGVNVVTYDHGHDLPPFDLAEMVARRAVWWVASPDSAVPSRAVSWSAAEGGGNFRLSTPKAGMTGDPEVDAVYKDYAVNLDSIGIA